MAKDREGVASGVLLTCMVKSWAAPTTAWPHPPGSARPLPSGHCPAELPWVLGGAPSLGGPKGTTLRLATRKAMTLRWSWLDVTLPLPHAQPRTRRTKPCAGAVGCRLLGLC